MEPAPLHTARNAPSAETAHVLTPTGSSSEVSASTGDDPVRLGEERGRVRVVAVVVLVVVAEDKEEREDERDREGAVLPGTLER